MTKSISNLIMEYFQKHPKEDLQHGPVVDWVTKQYLKDNSKPPRDPWRAIRNLHQEGTLIKVKKGVYRYDPDNIKDVELFDFPPRVKKLALKDGKAVCVLCGRGKKDGVEMCVDHIKPKDKGGDNSVDNAQVLCMECNLRKKNYSQTEAGKRFFIELYEKAVSCGDQKIINFCKCLFDCYDVHGINGHIPRPNGKNMSE